MITGIRWLESLLLFNNNQNASFFVFSLFLVIEDLRLASIEGWEATWKTIQGQEGREKEIAEGAGKKKEDPCHARQGRHRRRDH